MVSLNQIDSENSLRYLVRILPINVLLQNLGERLEHVKGLDADVVLNRCLPPSFVRADPGVA